ncbi:SDR family oxidoreductase [Staphylococcus simiae]|uniref:SDR family oxidoreductase n=1 Tax=Staphylococcus simiae TaxID=308354 RepID=UPI001A95C615|nr:SDR family oxidoreductase [Staphylococcus simiae]MBO1199057.1 SDR family oxidoreductase [Staphylococcus simiae]MBO1201325.1 SDR family oxidoreductase [Staphylococcus simiae]MBO1203431.1 SDR family oxidoreductase [Staphylococcus simiae]MBO1210959.1 SDR family oxidoreductase [Staphylococcus simiae]MBO1229663.1 SDR family oxidoreductase [Staphylococcus simiae]
MNNKVVLITGSSTGLGFETALTLAQNGYNVYATMRDLTKQQPLLDKADELNINLTVKQLDVTDTNSITQTVNDIVEAEGRLDILINNAGAGFVKTTELASDDELMWQMNVNLMSVMRMTKAVLPTMRSQRDGHIINISSVGGLVGQPFNEVYCAAKFGVEGYTESLASYVQPAFNVKFTVVEPGGIKTEFTNNVLSQLETTGGINDADYTALLNSYLGGLKENYGLDASQSGAEVARVILNVIEDANPPIRIRTSDWAERFTAIKTKADPTGKKLQQQVTRLLGDQF